MTDIFNEIDEEVRRDRLVAFWKRYGGWLIAALVVLIAGAAAYEGWQAYERRLAAADAAAFAAAEELGRQGKWTEAAAAFQQIAREGARGYRTLAGLRAGAAYVAAGDAGLASAEFDRLASESGTPQPYRDLAELFAAYHRLDAAPAAELRPRLERLAADGPWRFLARELLGLLALKAGDAEAARTALSEVADDPAAPAGSRARAAELLATLKSGA